MVGAYAPSNRRLVFRNHKFATTSTWEDSFSPVVDKTTLRLVFTMAAIKNLFMTQADVVTAYLNADMPAEVYIKLPRICGDDATMVRRLQKALYGHPKAGQLWNKEFVGFSRDEGFTATSRDRCLFFCPKPYFLLVLYVDDLLGACECKKYLEKFWKKLSTAFKIRDMGTPMNFLGMEVSHDPANIGSCIFLPQTKYIKELASKFHLPVELRPTKPICSDFYSLLETSIHSPVITEMPYKELVGALILSWFVLDLILHSLLHV